MALDYADAWLTSRQCPGLAWMGDQRRLLDELDAMLEEMSDPAKAALWTDEALRHGGGWSGVRNRARQALAALGAAVEDMVALDPRYRSG